MDDRNNIHFAQKKYLCELDLFRGF